MTETGQFLIGGASVLVTFEHLGTDDTVGIASVDSGSVVDGEFRPNRRQNGDQTHQGRHVQLGPGTFELLRVRLYRYR